MSEFFEPPPAPGEPEPRYRTPPWLGPPRGTLPAVVPLERVLARNDKVAVCATRLAVFQAGFELDVVTMSADDDPGLDPLLLFHARHRAHPDSGTEGIPAEMLRIGIQFADGSKATNTGGFHPPDDPPAGPVMRSGGGGGGGGSWQQTFWVWPLPPPGSLVLACEWPAREIPLTRCEIDAAPILDAATRAQVVFSDAHLPERPPDDAGPPVAFTG